MAHGTNEAEESKKDLSAALTGLVAGLVWILIVGGIAFEIAKHHRG
jgi:hypothetical protein